MRERVKGAASSRVASSPSHVRDARSPDQPPALHLTFYGHACFSLEAGRTTLLLDPYESGALGGAVALPPLPDQFDYVASTHLHVDHSATHTVPSADVLEGEGVAGPFHVERCTAFHDEYRGALRGGTTDVLRIRVNGVTVVHLGDLGERPTGALLDWLRQIPIDALLVPVGGYFTLSPLGAREVVRLLQPRIAVPCHSADDGVTLPQLQPLVDPLCGERIPCTHRLSLHRAEAAEPTRYVRLHSLAAPRADGSQG